MLSHRLFGSFVSVGALGLWWEALMVWWFFFGVSGRRGRMGLSLLSAWSYWASSLLMNWATPGRTERLLVWVLRRSCGRLPYFIPLQVVFWFILWTQSSTDRFLHLVLHWSAHRSFAGCWSIHSVGLARSVSIHLFCHPAPECSTFALSPPQILPWRYCSPKWLSSDPSSSLASIPELVLSSHLVFPSSW